MLKTPFKKLLSLMLTVTMVVSFFPATVMADESGASDLEGHWASEVMTEWIGYGIIAGYEDGTVRPDKSITRAEMTAMLDRVMGYQTMAANHFSDLDDNWYTEVILKGNAAGVISGYEDGTVRPNATISRQEATAMIARVLALDTENVPEADFTDSDAVADWAKDAVNAMAAKGYVNGSDGQFRPTAGMTRAEVVTILNNIFDKLYDENVTYISDSNGSAVINADDVTLKNLTVSGDLIVAQGVGDGHVVLDGVTVEGRLIVRGGGENSVIIRGDSKIGSVSIERIDGAVRVAVEGGASVSMISVADGSDTVTLQGNIGSLNIDNNNADVVVNGSVDDLNVLGQNATVEINGSVETLAVEGTNADLTIGGELTTVDIAAGASEASITIQRDGSVGTLITAAEKTTVTAQGDVTTVTVEETAADAEINIQSTSSVQNLTTSAQNTTVNVAGTVESISVNNGANNATITVDEDATASTITTDAANTTINGDGSVENVTVDENATGATVTTPGTSVENNSDEVVIVGEDETIGAGTTGTTPGGTTPTPTPDPTPTPTPDPEPEPVYYTVTYMNDEQTVTTQSVEANTAATAPTAETVGENWPNISKGNKLTWYNGAEPYNFETPVTGNLTLTAVIGSDDFQAGNGTEKYPYLIGNAAQFEAIDQVKATETVYYKLSNSFTVTGEHGTVYDTYFKSVIENLTNCVLDGNGQTITVSDAKDSLYLFYNVNEATLQDLNVVLDDAMCIYCSATTFNNVDVSGSFTVTGNTGAYVIYAMPLPTEADGKLSTTINFIDCNANVEMTGSGDKTNYNAVFVGYAMYSKSGDKYYDCYEHLNFTNCTNEGTLICGKASMFLANTPSIYAHPTITVNNCSNNGLIQAVSISDTDTDKYEDNGVYSHFASVNAQYATVVLGENSYTGEEVSAVTIQLPCGPNGEFVHGPTDSDLTLVKNDNDTFTITPSKNGNVSYYEVSVGVYATLIEGGTNRIYATERINASAANESLTTTLKNLAFVDETWVKSSNGATKGELTGNVIYTTMDGTSYYYIGDETSTGSTLGGTPKAPQMISVSAFDANGKVLASTSLSN